MSPLAVIRSGVVLCDSITGVRLDYKGSPHNKHFHGLLWGQGESLPRVKYWSAALKNSRVSMMFMC